MIETRASIYERAAAKGDITTPARDCSVHISSPRPRHHAQERAREEARATKPHAVALSLLLVGVTLGMLLSLLFMASDCQPATMMNTMRSLAVRICWHELLIGGIVVTALGIGIGGVFVGLAFAVVETLIHPQTKEPFIPWTPFTLDLPAEEVTFPSHNGKHLVRGIYCARPDATTTILLSPGYRRGYPDVLAMCKHLWAAGHHVLAFEYYGHGTVVGVPVTPGYREVEDFLGAVSYARSRAPETRIGALGYSMGGAVSIMGSAHTPEVEAVVADSAFASQWNAVEMAMRRILHLPSDAFPTAMRLLRRITDVVLAARAGYHFHQVEPWRAISRLAPRPVLLIHGLDDTVVHPGDSVQLYEAAGKPKGLWHVPGAEHGKAYVTDPQAYTTKVIAFFDRSLRPSAPAGSVSCQKWTNQESETVSENLCRSQRKPGGSRPGEPVTREAPGSTIPSQAATAQVLREIIASLFAVPEDQIESTSDVFDYIGDSQALARVLTQIEQHCHVRVKAGEVFDHPLVHDLAARIIRKRQGILAS